MGLVAALFIIIQVALNSKVLGRIVGKIAAEFVDGDLTFSRIHASVFTSFPNLAVTIDDFTLTYPHEKFAAYDSLQIDDLARRRFSLVKAGWGRETAIDTLASFTRARLSLDYVSLVSGRYHVPLVELDKPRVFLHRYDTSAANWNVIKINSKDEESSPLPPIKLHKIRLIHRPRVFFTDPVDTLFAMVAMKGIFLKGSIMSYDLPSSDVHFLLDSAFITGRLPADTLALAVERMEIDGILKDVSIKTRARTSLWTNSFGRLRVPLAIDGRGGYDQDTVRVDTLSLTVAPLTLGLSGRGTIDKNPYVDAVASIPALSIKETVDFLGSNFPEVKKLSTDAVVSANLRAKGIWNREEGKLPDIEAALSIPRSALRYEGIDGTGNLQMELLAATDSLSRLNVDIPEAIIGIYGASLKASAGARDVLGDDPALSLSGKLNARIDSLTHALTASKGIRGTGKLTGDISAKALLSQLNMGSIGKADIKADFHGRDLHITDKPDSILAEIPFADITVETRPNKIDRNLKKGARVLGLKTVVDTLTITYKEDMFIRGKDILLLAQNSDKLLKGGKNLSSFMGYLKAASLRLRSGDNIALGLRNNTETFRITPATKEIPNTKFSLRSKSERVFVRSDELRTGVRTLSFDVSANKHVADPALAQRRKHLLDSLQRMYPGVPRDSVLRVHFRSRSIPSWLAEKDFRAKDISLNLGESVRKYVAEWDFSGNLALESARIMTPAFPLKNYLKNVKGSFNNNEIKLDNLTINSGASDVSGKATLTGLRRALTSRTGRGMLNLSANITSNYIDANELMRAYAFSRTYEKGDVKVDENASDEEYAAKIENVEISDTTMTLIVVPSNLNANIVLEANKIRYDSLLVTWAAADIAMKQRTLQITNTVATSNMGDIYFEGFYTTRNKKEIKAGFDLNLVDITAEKVITLFPQVDTILPLLKNFAGDLDCEIAATTDLDTRMNLVLPSIDGIMKISGKDLSVSNSDFTKLAKLLMFKEKKKATVDKMSVSGMIRDNVLEVFPFILGVDRYTLAASGIQNLDKSFKYHISVIKSPIPLKFGINMYGKDFDHKKYQLCKAKYRDTKVPVFTKELNAVQYNLLDNIHNIFEIGVEKAIAENKSQNLIQAEKDRQNYSATAGTEALNENESASLDKAMKEAESNETQQEAAPQN